MPNRLRKVYLDYAATTPVDRQVLRALRPFFGKKFGNPSEYHKMGLEAKEALEKARVVIAQFLRAKTKEIIFTGSATEAINFCHKGLIEALAGDFPKKPHLIVSSVEHKAVLETVSHLARLKQAEVTYLPVDREGRVKLSELKRAIRKETVLISIMYVNNEVGTIQPIEQIGNFLARQKQKIYFACDATQAISYLTSSVDRLKVDFLCFTGHKIYAPKGVGVLYARRGVPLAKFLDGGAQERNLRAGTENVPYIVAIGKAISLISQDKERNRLEKLRDKIINGILRTPGIILTGHPRLRAPHIASFIVQGIEGEALVLRLSDLGIYASSGSACTASDLKPSHVLTAMGYKPEESHGSIRFSLGKGTRQADIDYLLKVFPGVVEDLRRMSPTWNSE